MSDSETMAASATHSQALAPEDAARAGFYALLARLYAAGPDAALLSAIASAAPLPPDAGNAQSAGMHDGADLAGTWDALRVASRAADEVTVRQEYDDLFVGVGKSELNLHASHWLTGFMMEKPLAEVRASLSDLGLARKPDATMVEDHLAALCETMRILIAGQGNMRPATFGDQRRFFDRHLAVWVFPCCDAMATCSLAYYYREVAQFSKAFLALERDSFAMD